jgi:hypothetical protein
MTARRARRLIGAVVSAAVAVWLVVPWVVWSRRTRQAKHRPDVTPTSRSSIVEARHRTLVF